jgi:hypothetical protein
VGCVTVGVSVRVWPTVTEAELGDTVRLVIAAGAGSTVIVAVPMIPSIVAVIVAVPGAMPVTSPLVLTMAAAAFKVAQLTVRPVSVCPAESRAITTNCCVAPARMLASVGATLTVATGTAVTVAVTVAVLDAAENPVFPTAVAVTVMMAVPGPTARMSPAADTVATLGAVVPKVTDAAGAPDGCETTGAIVDVLPTSRLTAVCETVTEVTDVGSGETATDMVPGTPPTVAVIVTLPTATAVTRPVALTVATA